MDIVELALEARKSFQSLPGSDAFHRLNHVALLGFFDGVAKGSITLGQGWAGNILRAAGYKLGDAEKLTEAQYEMLHKVFASGMCCEGQPLGNERGKSFAERTV